MEDIEDNIPQEQASNAPNNEENDANWIQISNVPWEYLEVDIARSFSKFGSIRSIECMESCAHVCYENGEMAQAAVAGMDGRNFLGNTISVVLGPPAPLDKLEDSDFPDDLSPLRDVSGERGGDSQEAANHGANEGSEKQDAVTTGSTAEGATSQHHKGDKRAPPDFESRRGRDMDSRDNHSFNSRGPRDRGPAGPGLGKGRRTEFRVLVFNLDDQVSWQDLKDFARNAGDVNFANVFSRAGRKTGIIEYFNSESLRRAATELHGRRLYSKRVHLEEDCGQFEPRRPIAPDDSPRDPAPSSRPGVHGGPDRLPYMYKPSTPAMPPHSSRPYRSRSRSPRHDPPRGHPSAMADERGSRFPVGSSRAVQSPRYEPTRSTRSTPIRDDRNGSIRHGAVSGGKSYGLPGAGPEGSSRSRPPPSRSDRPLEKLPVNDYPGDRFDRRRADVTPLHPVGGYGYREKDIAKPVDRTIEERRITDRGRPVEKRPHSRGRDASWERGRRYPEPSRSDRKTADEFWYRDVPVKSHAEYRRPSPSDHDRGRQDTSMRDYGRRSSRKGRLGNDGDYQTTGSRRPV